MMRVLELAGAATPWTWIIEGFDHHCRLVGTVRPHLEIVPDAEQQMDAEIAAIGGTGVWAAQFGPGQYRCWFVPNLEMDRDALFDRVAGIIARELGKHVLLSALWMYPRGKGAPRGVTFMLHLLAREQPQTDFEPSDEYTRILTAIVDQLADRSKPHWPPASDEVS